ncbi:MAG: type I DNA topoisomerase [bacterium]|nr:type I DNA topoisomerase [bacterium]
MNIVIVESAAKAKTINKYLGSDYKVIASIGHVRDLPSQNGSVEPDNDFTMHWESDPRGAKTLKEITAAVKGSDKLILATDPDREGEAISWHILQVLEQRKALNGVEVERVAFNAVTKSAIMEALGNPRELDTPLVDAYLARRALDYLVGFTLSPVLWRKLPGSRSAGRVQSVALRLVCERETEIELFKPREYWTIEALMNNEAGDKFTSRLVSIEGKRLGKFDLPDKSTALPAQKALQTASFEVNSIVKKPQKRRPPPPFATSTLQMDASRRFGFSASRTMQVAQKLYEGVSIGSEAVGLITYMRTDAISIVPEAIQEARAVVADRYGKNYHPEEPRIYKTKAKNAQEAHEAVRPTDFARHPDDIAKYLDADQIKLYGLIWRRTVASQMSDAVFDRTTVEIAATGTGNEKYGLRATGQVLRFDGFLTLYREGREEDDKSESDDDKRLPLMNEKEKPTAQAINADQHFTEPPPRYSEATLVKRMEELGIGRPSTYASTLSVLQSREYVRIDKKKLIPEDKGRLVTAFLESFFERYVEYDFTAGLEEKLDIISAGKLSWKEVLNEFWTKFIAKVNEIKDLRVTEVLDALNELLGPHVFPDPGDGSDPRKCPKCDDGRISLKVGRFGAFIGCSNYPECRFTRQFSESNEEAGETSGNEDRMLGVDPDTGFDVFFKTGRFGPYVQLGEPEDYDKKKKEKPKRMSLPKGMEPATVDFEQAQKLLSLPREVGTHPEDDVMITASIGRYGPFVKHKSVYANLDKDNPEEVFTIGINRAVTVLAEKKTKQNRGATVLKELGEHPDETGAVQVLDGRYGPYVKHGKINATIPKGTDPQDVTMEDAVKLIAERAAKSNKKKPARKKAAPKKKAAARKKPSTKNKSPAKKKAAAAKPAE